MEELLAAVAARVLYMMIEALVVRVIRAFTVTPAPARA
jgi:hypothetical protein